MLAMVAVRTAPSPSFFLMYTHPAFRPLAFLYKVLGNERRLKILTLFLQRPRTNKELSILLGIHPASVSDHLYALQRANLIIGHRKSKKVFFSVTDALTIRKLLSRKSCSQRHN